MSEGDAALDEAVRAHDRAVAALGLPIWVGGEPTFTDRLSFDAPWTTAALGGDKEPRARGLVRAIAPSMPGVIVVRTIGRQYPGEPRARFSYGLYARRDGASVVPVGAPRDPILVGVPLAPAPLAPERLRDALATRLAGEGFAVRVADVAGPLPARVAFAQGDAPAALAALDDAAFARASIHDAPLPEEGPRDALAPAGALLVAIGVATIEDDLAVLRVELPAMGDVPAFLALARAIADAAVAIDAPALVWTGFAPPVDASVAFTTVTPDPAVVEVNAAPSRDVAEYLAAQRALHAAAAAIGLSAVRLAYDGDVLDSGGGGHVTLGGPSPAESPFARALHALPGLVRYANRHPSLSYLFAVDSLGASSQSPRADEGLAESSSELALALARLARSPAPDVDALWAAIAPFLADHAGNAHRAEINVEKLASPRLPGRGRLGLVELRAMRMADSPARAAAVAALVRAIAARVAASPYEEPLAAWGPALHDRFALPFFLRADLDAVLEDLEAHGVGLAPVLADELRRDEARAIGDVPLAPGVVAHVGRALEFWPLLGDAASQERHAARFIDASTRRVEIVVRSEDRSALDGVVACARGVRLPLVRARDREGEALVAAVRYRAFAPRLGLHPSVPAEGPLELVLAARGEPAVRATLHPWIPGGGAYDGLPRDRDEARRRRGERLVVEAAPSAILDAAVDAPPGARAEHALDLRFL
jgi:uncharacterized protein (DUF2126 family)